VRVNAFDYLMKPIRPERLAAALEKTRGALLAHHTSSERPGTTQAVKAHSASDRIFIRDGERCWIVTVLDIALIEAEGNYSRVYFGGNHPLVRTSISALE